jgi:hypothetical protein
VAHYHRPRPLPSLIRSRRLLGPSLGFASPHPEHNEEGLDEEEGVEDRYELEEFSSTSLSLDKDSEPLIPRFTSRNKLAPQRSLLSLLSLSAVLLTLICLTIQSSLLASSPSQDPLLPSSYKPREMHPHSLYPNLGILPFLRPSTPSSTPRERLQMTLYPSYLASLSSLTPSEGVPTSHSASWLHIGEKV